MRDPNNRLFPVRVPAIKSSLIERFGCGHFILMTSGVRIAMLGYV
jgi:hypothetical protein